MSKVTQPETTTASTHTGRFVLFRYLGTASLEGCLSYVEGEVLRQYVTTGGNSFATLLAAQYAGCILCQDHVGEMVLVVKDAPGYPVVCTLTEGSR